LRAFFNSVLELEADTPTSITGTHLTAVAVALAAPTLLLPSLFMQPLFARLAEYVRPRTDFIASCMEVLSTLLTVRCRQAAPSADQHYTLGAAIQQVCVQLAGCTITDDVFALLERLLGPPEVRVLLSCCVVVRFHHLPVAYH
jgi:hypothetical protein